MGAASGGVEVGELMRKGQQTWAGKIPRNAVTRAAVGPQHPVAPTFPLRTWAGTSTGVLAVFRLSLSAAQ